MHCPLVTRRMAVDSERMLGSAAEQAVNEGVVSVRDLSRNATQILRAVEKLGKPVLVTRHGRIVATLSPLKVRDLLDRLLEKDEELQESLEEARAERARRTEQA
jgi:prevent-host-death family protein